MRFLRFFPSAVVLGASWLVFFSMAMPETAHAALVFCNKTSSPIEAALGRREQDTDDGGDTWVSEGWWRIEPDQCSRVYAQPLTERFYFYYATTLSDGGDTQKKPFIWQGKYQFCIDNKAFRVEGDGDCTGRGYRARGFQQIDHDSNSKDYTLDFKDGG